MGAPAERPLKFVVIMLLFRAFVELVKVRGCSELKLFVWYARSK